MIPALCIACALLAQPQAIGQTRDAPRPASTGVISGRVIEKDSGRPLHRAIVTLVPPGNGTRREAITDPDGRYEFTALEPGNYAVVAEPGELRTTHLRQVFGQTAPVEFVPPRPQPAVALKSGERRTDVVIVMTRALAIEGRVLDETGEPMSDVEVTVIRADGTERRNALSDDRGEYRAFGLAPGRYRVCASVMDYGNLMARATSDSRLVRTCHPSAMSETAAADVVLTTSVASAIDIQMQRISAYSLSGVVLEASGNPAKDAWISASSVDRNGGAAARINSEDGRFVLKGLTPGRYILSAGFGGADWPNDRRDPVRHREMGYVPVELGDGDMTGLVVTLSRGERITGTVAFEGEPRPASKSLAIVVQAGTALRREPVAQWQRPTQAAVKDDLAFELTDVFRQPQVISVFGLPDGWVVKTIRHDGRDITGIPTEFGSGAGTHPIEIVVTNHVALPSVRVVDEQGQPVTTFNVVLFPADRTRWKGTYPGVPGTPSSDGVLPLGSRLPGDYFLAALTWDDYRVLLVEPDRLDAVAAIADRVSFTEGDRRTIEIHVRRLPPQR